MSLMALKGWLEATLGRCPRCMALTAAFIVLCWFGLAALMSTSKPPLAALILATFLALGASLLGVAHAAAFIARKVSATSFGAGRGPAALAVRAASDCGCRGRAAPARPLAISVPGVAAGATEADWPAPSLHKRTRNESFSSPI